MGSTPTIWQNSRKTRHIKSNITRAYIYQNKKSGINQSFQCNLRKITLKTIIQLLGFFWEGGELTKCKTLLTPTSDFSTLQVLAFEKSKPRTFQNSRKPLAYLSNMEQSNKGNFYRIFLNYLQYIWKIKMALSEQMPPGYNHEQKLKVASSVSSNNSIVAGRASSNCPLKFWAVR